MLVLFATLFALSSFAAEARSVKMMDYPGRCGPNFGGQRCPSGCCSQYSFCGYENDWCGPNVCQKGYGACWQYSNIGLCVSFWYHLTCGFLLYHSSCTLLAIVTITELRKFCISTCSGFCASFLL